MSRGFRGEAAIVGVADETVRDNPQGGPRFHDGTGLTEGRCPSTANSRRYLCEPIDVLYVLPEDSFTRLGIQPIGVLSKAGNPRRRMVGMRIVSRPHETIASDVIDNASC